MRTLRPLLLLLAIAALVGACGSSSASLGTVGNGVDESGSGSGTAAGGAPAPAASAAAGLVDGSGSTPGDGSGPTAAVDDAKIIRTGAMSLEVKDVPTAIRTARDGIIGLGGYIGASTTGTQGDRPTATITYRIPADRWEPALDLLHSLAGQTTKVVTEHTEAVEVTGQVVDLEARIRNLDASEVALQAIAATATKISDVLEVQARLTDVRGQIEELTGQLKALNDKAAYGTLETSFNVPVVAAAVQAKGWDPGAAVDEASASLISVLQALATAGIWLVIVWLPILLMLGVVGGIAAWATRRAGLWGRRPGTPPTAPPTAPPASPPSTPLATEG
jgi:hypothetical protein